ncbi:MAG: tRNA1Val (adenine37-N6)-methyltransferase [Paracoccaceae bacterium]
MTFPDDALSCDGFLDGKLSVLQPKQGYRAATDPVFLAASVNANVGQSVLELGCGAGVALLCLGARVSGLGLTGVELQPDYADLARRNAVKNEQDLKIINADLSDLPPDLRQVSFDHVIANPPYLGSNSGSVAQDAGKNTAFREETPLAEWIDTGIRRLTPGGYLTLIHLVERLPELLANLDRRVGNIEVKPLAPRLNRAAGRVIIRARKGGGGAFRLHPPFVVHRGDQHDGDRENLSELASDILRNGAALTF